MLLGQRILRLITLGCYKTRQKIPIQQISTEL